MPPSPRIMLSIDYEPWFALTRRHDRLAGAEQRRDLDGGFSLAALEPILDLLGNARCSFYMVGEIAEWYPQVPELISAAGHELGFHCHFHRSLLKPGELKQDLTASSVWLEKYHVRGYRAPMIGIDEEAYAMLAEHGFLYSSSTYAPAGVLLKKNTLWEIPVSTMPIFGRRKNEDYNAPRKFTLGLLAGGEIPYGSSFLTGLMPNIILRILESELRAGLSPVIFLHPYEIIRPDSFIWKMARDLAAYPLLLPFTANKANFLTTLIKNFPVSPLNAYLEEALDV
jgi:hypothetical protein